MVSCFPRGGMVSCVTQGLNGAKNQNDCISCVAALVASVYDPCADCNRSWVHRWSCFDVIELLLSGLFVAPVVSVILHGIYVFVCSWLVALVCAVGGECAWVVVAATE